jgi:hypothetical protein
MHLGAHRSCSCGCGGAVPTLLHECCVLCAVLLFSNTQERAEESQDMISRQTAKLLDDRCVR